MGRGGLSERGRSNTSSSDIRRARGESTGQSKSAESILYGSTPSRGYSAKDKAKQAIDVGTEVTINQPGQQNHLLTGVVTHIIEDDNGILYEVKKHPDAAVVSYCDLTSLVPAAAGFKGGELVMTTDGPGVFKMIEDGGDGTLIYNVVLDEDRERDGDDAIAHEYSADQVEAFDTEDVLLFKSYDSQIQNKIYQNYQGQMQNKIYKNYQELNQEAK